MMEIVFKDKTTLIIESELLEKLYSYVQVGSAPENGGVLLGKKDVESETYFVTDLSVPSSKDIKGIFSFIRNKDVTQKLIDQRWKDSDGIENYLGEWHTHPEMQPTPSSVDKKLINIIIEDKSNVFSKVFLIILGIDKSIYVGLANADISKKIIDFKIIKE